MCDVICWLMALSAGAVAASPSITTCEEFEHEAYFNPYYVIDSLWKIFYFWANSTEMYPVSFSLPAKQVRNETILLGLLGVPTYIAFNHGIQSFN